MEEEAIHINYTLTREEFEDDIVGRKLSDSEWNIVRETVTEALGEAFSELLYAESDLVKDGGYA